MLQLAFARLYIERKIVVWKWTLLLFIDSKLSHFFISSIFEIVAQAVN